MIVETQLALVVLDGVPHQVPRAEIPLGGEFLARHLDLHRRVELRLRDRRHGLARKHRADGPFPRLLGDVGACVGGWW